MSTTMNMNNEEAAERIATILNEVRDSIMNNTFSEYLNAPKSDDPRLNYKNWITVGGGAGSDCFIRIDEDGVKHSTIRPENLEYQGPKNRKKRSDVGRRRKPSTWIKFVKAVQERYGVSYREAMTLASELKRDGYTIHTLDNADD